jgi:hypothetical protein
MKEIKVILFCILTSVSSVIEQNVSISSGIIRICLIQALRKCLIISPGYSLKLKITFIMKKTSNQLNYLQIINSF